MWTKKVCPLADCGYLLCHKLMASFLCGNFVWLWMTVYSIAVVIRLTAGWNMDIGITICKDISVNKSQKAIWWWIRMTLKHGLTRLTADCMAINMRCVFELCGCSLLDNRQWEGVIVNV